ncbi:MAG: YqaA family protein [Candidatus Nanohaloarchaea archaeon]
MKEWLSGGEQGSSAFRILIFSLLAVGTVLLLVYLTSIVILHYGYDPTGLKQSVQTARGVTGFMLVFIYSFLVAVILPLPSEIVLAAPIGLGMTEMQRLVALMVVSGLGKALGSLVALQAGMTAKKAGKKSGLAEKTGFDLVAWSQSKTFQAVRKYGYIGMAMALSVPFFPDTISIYAFSVLENDWLRFTAAAFVGSVGRLFVTVLLIKGIISF